MSTAEYLERARQCRALADRTEGKDKTMLRQIADALLKIAAAEAKDKLDQNSSQP